MHVDPVPAPCNAGAAPDIQRIRRDAVRRGPLRALLAGAAAMTVAMALHPAHAVQSDGVAAPEGTNRPPENWAIHGQVTNVTQSNGSFRSPYQGTNSLISGGRTEETTDLTLYGGARPWQGGEIWLNLEVDQGFGLSNTVGAAGYPSGEAYKIGANRPYLRVPRLFYRHVVPLGPAGAENPVEPAANQLGGVRPASNLTITLGKFSAVDLFDTNTYAHDPRADFLNWSIIDSGAFDYAADPWGYTYGAAAEWNSDRWTLRGGAFQLSELPNAKVTKLDARRYMLVAEAELRHEWEGHPGKLKLLAFLNHAPMARYDDAANLALATGEPADAGSVRRPARRAGVALNLEQEIATGLGTFLRASSNDGSKEAYEFTEINRSLAWGASLQGSPWGRHDDRLGVAAAVNQLSAAARRYFQAGGLGILIGDGRLDYGAERIVEAYYALQWNPRLGAALDWQHIRNPAYNRDRGPVTVWGLRLHAEF